MEKIVATAVLTIVMVFIGIPLLGKISMNPLAQDYQGYLDFFFKGCEVLFYVTLALFGFYLIIWSLSTLGA